MGDVPAGRASESVPLDANLSLVFPGVREWLFCPGMLFQAREKWWGDRGPRPRPHEGLDLVVYTGQEGGVFHVSETAPLCAVSDGLILGVIPDFLGRSVIVEHPDPNGTAGRLYVIYAHTLPMKGIGPGRAVKRGEAIATVAVPKRPSAPMAPHLHLTIARSARPDPSRLLDWDTIGGSDAVTLMDPLQVTVCPHRLMGKETPPCRVL